MDIGWCLLHFTGVHKINMAQLVEMIYYIILFISLLGIATYLLHFAQLKKKTASNVETHCIHWFCPMSTGNRRIKCN